MLQPDLIKLTRRFGQEIDGADRSNWGVAFKHYPRGACSAVSGLLGTYLFEEHGFSTELIHATHKAGFEPHGFHSWLEADGLIIDLTCDQFSHDPLSAPYIGRDRSWHNQWKIDGRDDMGTWIPINRNHMSVTCGEAYKDILQRLSA